MIALDTNVLARFLLGDDDAQLKRAKALLKKKQRYTAPISVILELVWVLESNDLNAHEIEQGLRRLLGLPNFETNHTAELALALSWYANGMGMADALHLALCQHCKQLATFDKRFVKAGAECTSTAQVAEVP